MTKILFSTVISCYPVICRISGRTLVYCTVSLFHIRHTYVLTLFLATTRAQTPEAPFDYDEYDNQEIITSSSILNQ